MNFDEKLKLLIDKYGLESKTRKQTIIEKEIIHIWDTIPHESNIAIWGAGVHTNELLNLVSIEEKNIVCILDKAKETQGQEIFGHIIKDPTYLKNNKVDTVIISSYAHKEDIAYEIENTYGNIKYIDIYKELEKKDIYLQGAFFFSYGDYLELYRIRKSYEKEKNLQDKERILHQLICKYLEIKDFVNTTRFCDVYIENEFSRSIEFKEFLKELNQLFLDVKTTLNSRQTQDIIMVLMDAVRSKDIINDKVENSMPFIKKISEDSLVYSKAFSTNLHTRMSILSMLTGRLPIDDELYNRDVIELEESPLLKYLNEKNYKIQHYTIDKKFIKENIRFESIELRDKEKVINGVQKEIKKLAPSVFWRLICELEKNSNKDVFAFLHLIAETHRPHICGYHENEPLIHKEVKDVTEYINEYVYEDLIQTKDEFINQYNECLRYLDEQIEFYMQFISENSIKIFLSDHGQVIDSIFDSSDNLFSIIGSSDDKIHVPLIIRGPNIEAEKNDNLFSMKYLGSLIISILEGKLLNYNSQFIENQFEPIYNPKAQKNYICSGGQRFIGGFKTIRTEKWKYILYSNGEEEFYSVFNEHVNLINNETYKNKIEKIKKHMGNLYFPKL